MLIAEIDKKIIFNLDKNTSAQTEKIELINKSVIFKNNYHISLIIDKFEKIWNLAVQMVSVTKHTFRISFLMAFWLMNLKKIRSLWRPKEVKKGGFRTKKKKVWPRRDLNTQPFDLESNALPLRHGVLCLIRIHASELRKL